MKNESKTLFITLYGKAYASGRGLILKDKRAEEIFARAGVELKGKSRSKWLAFNMAMRAAVIDRLTEKYIAQNPDCCVICPGCGLDSRLLRVKARGKKWYDLDFPEVMALRAEYFAPDEREGELPSSVADLGWLSHIDGDIDTCVIAAEGLMMYLPEKDIAALLAALAERFKKTVLICDMYSRLSVKLSGRNNPAVQLGASIVYGMDEPEDFTALHRGVRHLETAELLPESMISSLPSPERQIFRMLYAGRLTGKLYKKLYRIFVFEISGTR